MRLDIFLTQNLNTTRNQVNNLIKKNLVQINGRFAHKSGIQLKNGDEIEILALNESTQELEKKSNIAIERIYEDSDILIINKPPFLATHGAISLKEESLVDWLKAHKIQLSNLAGEKKEGIIHRLDKQTSGAMVIAKNNIAHSFLSTQLQNRQMGRIYIALIDMPLKNDLVIECNIARNSANRLKFTKAKFGRYSKSSFKKLLVSNDGKKELILAKLFTGRTHQIRVHLESINRHILGDELYGYKGESMRVMLHSYLLFLTHPNRAKMSFQAKIFDDMQNYLEQNFNMEMVNEILANINPSIVF